MRRSAWLSPSRAKIFRIAASLISLGVDGEPFTADFTAAVALPTICAAVSASLPGRCVAIVVTTPAPGMCCRLARPVTVVVPVAFLTILPNKPCSSSSGPAEK